MSTLRPDSLQFLECGAWCLPWEGWAHFCFSFHGNKSQLQLGPLSRLEPITHRGSGSSQPAVRTPDVRLAQRVSDCWKLPSSDPWQPGSGATSQRPGIRERKEGYSAPSWVCALFARLTPVPSSFCPPQEGRQPASPAPGQMHGLRIDLTCDLGSCAQSK